MILKLSLNCVRCLFLLFYFCLEVDGTRVKQERTDKRRLKICNKRWHVKQETPFTAMLSVAQMSVEYMNNELLCLLLLYLLLLYLLLLCLLLLCLLLLCLLLLCLPLLWLLLLWLLFVLLVKVNVTSDALWPKSKYCGGN